MVAMIHLFYFQSMNHELHLSFQLDSSISYSTNAEYRAALRTFFLMNPTLPDTASDLDKESLDELLFDDKHMIRIFDEIYEKTRHSTLFMELYELAAACFISTDTQLGVTVLFAYDYFGLFYPLLYDFFHSSENLSNTNEHYVNLKKYLSRR